jgi:DNA ligase-1
MITKPMLASAVEDLADLHYPVLCTPKLDGFRCLKVNGKALTRSFKPVPNVFVREWIEANLPDGVDGELMLRNGTFNETASAIGQRGGSPDFIFYVFDIVGENGLNERYQQRIANLMSWFASARRKLGDKVRLVLPYSCGNVTELDAYEAEMLAQGYEGVMIRKPSGPYKCGRSTVREQWLLKLKRFTDSEAVILDTFEKETNTNEAFTDELGRTKRSTAQAGKVGVGSIGGFRVKDCTTGVEFCCGFNHTKTDMDPRELWSRRSELVGQVIKYKSQPSGAKDAPRFPQFLGFRPGWDMETAGSTGAANCLGCAENVEAFLNK